MPSLMVIGQVAPQLAYPPLVFASFFVQILYPRPPSSTLGWSDTDIQRPVPPTPLQYKRWQRDQ